MWSFRPNVRPSVQLTQFGGPYVLPTNVVVSANAVDDGEIRSVEFFVNGNSIGTAQTPPFVKSWNDPSAGNFQVFARVTDEFAATGDSAILILPVFVRPEVKNQVLENNRGIGFDFLGTTGQTYTVQYSSDLTNWVNATPNITGTGSLLHWHDSGPPVTDSLPSTEPQRFYRIVVSR